VQFIIGSTIEKRKKYIKEQLVEGIIKALMGDILDMDAQSIDESTSMESLDAWGSLAHLNICFAVEQEFGIRLEVSEMEEMVSYVNIVAVLKARKDIQP
jgi:acyl carrier protein